MASDAATPAITFAAAADIAYDAATPAVPDPAAAAPRKKPAPAKRRGSYNCGRCGVPKKGHVCSFQGPVAAAASLPAGEPQPQPLPPPPHPQPQPQTKPRRALQFDDPSSSSSSPSPLPPPAPASSSSVVLNAVPLAAVAPPHPRPRPHPQPRPASSQAAAKGKQVVDVEAEDGDGDEDGEDEDYPPLPWVEVGAGRRAPGAVLLEVLRRLPPRGVAAAAGVSRGWRDVSRRFWGLAEEVRLCAAGVGPVTALVARCPALTRLALELQSDVDSTLLACIAFNCPNLQSLDISMVNSAANRITGGELSRFVSERRSLSVLKLNGCSSLGFLNVSSSSLLTLWISGLCSLTKAVINCPNLIDLSLQFSEQNNDSTDLVALMDSLGRTCPYLRAMNIASTHLCNEAVFALESANLRGLRMLCLLRGSQITDAAVTSIVRSYTSLEMLDLTGSCITDNGLTMISNAFPKTLTHLGLALCPSITSFGVQVATAQLPLLHIMDCGWSICATPEPEAGRSYFGDLYGGIKFCSKLPVHRKQQTTRQKLVIKHNNLKKLSLWGCSAIDALYVNCPELVDLNLNLCTNLHPERLMIQCPKLKDVHANGCSDMVIGAIRNQVLNEFTAIEPQLPRKRWADGRSKRVQQPHFMIDQLVDQEKWGKPRESQCTVHLD